MTGKSVIVYVNGRAKIRRPRPNVVVKNHLDNDREIKLFIINEIYKFEKPEYYNIFVSIYGENFDEFRSLLDEQKEIYYLAIRNLNTIVNW